MIARASETGARVTLTGGVMQCLSFIAYSECKSGAKHQSECDGYGGWLV